jgi:hypothetical protein
VYSPGTVSVRDYDGTNVASAQVTMSRYYGNGTIPNQVQSGTTDVNGDVVFVAESVTAFYTFSVSVDGSIVYNETTPNLLTVDSTGLWQKTIVLLRTGTDAVAKNTGFSYNFTPQGVLYNNTFQNFTVSLYSADWSVNQCYFYLYGATSGLLNSSSGFCGVTGGTSTLWYNITTTESLYVKVIVETLLFSNTYTNNYEVVQNGTGNYTLMVLAGDLKAFSGFGFNDFSRFLIAVIVILAVIGGLSVKTNYINNPEELLFIIFLLTLGFSYIDWMNLNLQNIPVPALNQYFITLFMGLATILTGLRKWGVFNG